MSKPILVGKGRGRILQGGPSARSNDLSLTNGQDCQILTSHLPGRENSQKPDQKLDPSPVNNTKNTTTAAATAVRVENDSSSCSDLDSDGDDGVSFHERARLRNRLRRYKLEREAQLKGVTVNGHGDNKSTTESTCANIKSNCQTSPTTTTTTPVLINNGQVRVLKEKPASTSTVQPSNPTNGVHELTEKLKSLNQVELDQHSSKSNLSTSNYLLDVKRNNKFNNKNHDKFDSVSQLDYYFDLRECIGKRFLLQEFDFKFESVFLLPSQDCKIKKFKDDYFKLRDEINDHCIDGTVTVKDPYLGQIVCVSHCGEFARACIQDIDLAGAFAIIKLIDVGGETKVPLKSLFQINNITMKFPIFGQEVKLAHIEKNLDNNIWPIDKENFHNEQIGQVIIPKIIGEGVVFENIGLKKLLHEQINDLKTWIWEKLVRDHGVKNDAELLKVCSTLPHLTNLKTFKEFPTSVFKLNTIYTAQMGNYKFDSENGSLVVCLHNFVEYFPDNSNRKGEPNLDTFYNKAKRILESQCKLYEEKVPVQVNYYPKNGDSFFAKIGALEKMPGNAKIHFNDNSTLVRGFRQENHLLFVDHGGLFFPATGNESTSSAADIQYRVFCSDFLKIPSMSVQCIVKNSEGFKKKGEKFLVQIKQFLTGDQDQKLRFKIVHIDQDDKLTIELIGFK